MPAVTSESTGLGTLTGTPPVNSIRLAPSKGKWIQREFQSFQTSMMTDAAMLSHRGDTDLIEACCTRDSMLSKVAQPAGVATERWTISDYGLSTESGYAAVEQRLRSVRPRRPWLSPECGPFSQMQHLNQNTPDKIGNLIEKRRIGFAQWRNCLRLAWVQLALGGGQVLLH